MFLSLAAGWAIRPSTPTDRAAADPAASGVWSANGYPGGPPAELGRSADGGEGVDEQPPTKVGQFHACALRNIRSRVAIRRAQQAHAVAVPFIPLRYRTSPAAAHP